MEFSSLGTRPTWLCGLCRQGGFATLSLVVLLTMTGCLRPAPPRLDLEKPTPPPASLDLADYLRAGRLGEWIYERTELGSRKDDPPTRYVRRMSAGRLSEGVLSNRDLPSLRYYLETSQTGQTATQPAGAPPALPEREAPRLFEVSVALPLVPIDLTGDSPVSSSTILRLYNRRGDLQRIGTLTRTVRLDGTQEVTVPAGRFADCLRVRVMLRMEFAMGLEINWNSYIWLSREAGEVRRIDDFSGALWIFGFGSAHEYQLVSFTRDEPPRDAPELSPGWARGLITVDRPIPRPRVSGIMIDFAVPSGQTD